MTSGGLLGAITGFTSLLQQQGAIQENKVISFKQGPPVCAVQDDQTSPYAKVRAAMADLEKKVTSTSPIDFTLPGFMMSRGPFYLHMTYGFENDVAYLNEHYKEQLLYLWNDTLAFLYLDPTYFIEHPICKLTAAPWYTEDVAVVADIFVKWIIDNNAARDLKKYGFRPVGVSLNATSSIINEENGCNLEIDEANTDEIPKASVQTAHCMRQLYQVQKKDLQLTILLDVSDGMSASVGDALSRWNAVSASLPTLPAVLGANDQIYLRCFESEVLPVCSKTNYPNGTLQSSRDALMEYLSTSVAPRSGQTGIDAFAALNETFLEVSAAEELWGSRYRYVILMITEEDNVDNQSERAKSLLNTIGLEFDPNQIHIYPILYFADASDSITATTLEEIATRTNGQFATATNEDLAGMIQEFSFYW